MNQTGVLIAGRVSFEVAGRTILDDIGVEIRKAESVAIVGVNGAGKTTLLRLMAGVVAPTRGALSFADTDYRTLGARRLARSLSYVPQVRPARVPLTVRDVVLLGRYPHHSRWRFGYGVDDFRAANSALEVAGLAELGERPLAELSGGERQGVYIAAALAQETECLLLDEPTTYLDPGHQRRVAGILRRLIRRERRTVVFASHDLNLAHALADRVMVLADGRLAASGATAEILEPALLERIFDAPFHIHHAAAAGKPSGRASPVVTVDLDPEPERLPEGSP